MAVANIVVSVAIAVIAAGGPGAIAASASRGAFLGADSRRLHLPRGAFPG